MNTTLARIQVGLGAWLSALKALRSRPRLWWFVLVPLLVYGLFLSILLVTMVYQVQPQLLEWLAGFFTSSWVLSVMKFLSYVGAFVLWALLIVPVYALSNLIMSPVHSLAAERILKRGGAEVYVPAGVVPWVKFFFRSLGIGLLKSTLLIAASIPLFLGGFLPGVGVAFVFLSFVILSFDCTDYSLEVLGLSLKERFAYLSRHRWEYAGFSAVFFAASFVPLAMLLVLPVGIIAGAHLVLSLSPKKGL